MKLDIIQKIKKRHITSEHVMWLSIIVLFSILCTYYFEIILPNIFINILLLASFLTPVATNIYGKNEYYPRNFKITSNLKLKATYIEIGSKRIDINKISMIEIFVNDWYGKRTETNSPSLFGWGPNLSQGIDNLIRIYWEGNNIEIINFQIKSVDQLEKLKIWIRILYQNDIVIVEEFGYSKSYGLEHLNYAEIQEFKANYIKKKAN